MKTLKLLLPDNTYKIAADLAQLEDVEIGQFATGILSEALTCYQVTTPKTSAPKLNEAAGVNLEISKTVEQIYQVCVRVWLEHRDVSEAIKLVADHFQVNETTIRDKCTRRINLPSISSFKELLAKPDALVRHLCERFHSDAKEIRQLFGEEIQVDDSKLYKPSLSVEKPAAKKLHELDLISAIVTILKRNGGKMNKPEVEKAVFDQYADIFRHEWYQASVGGGVPRWLKNVQFARNTACNILRLLKFPHEAGRGVWELTEEGEKMGDTLITQSNDPVVQSGSRNSPPNFQN
jgi:hypothetical protein